jgi:riboflavin-specific deaminase-like protein
MTHWPPRENPSLAAREADSAAALLTAKERPFVSVNFAQTWDAKIATRNYSPSLFSSPTDKHRLLEIRASADAVLVGAKTLAADRMTLGLPDSTLQEARLRAGKPAFPLRVIATSSGVLSPQLRVFQSEGAPIVVFSTQRMPIQTRTALEQRAHLHLSDGSQVDLPDLLRTLRTRYCVAHLVCEGGPSLLRSLLERNLVDQLHLTLCPRLFGGAGAPTLTGRAGNFLPVSRQLKLATMQVQDGECFLSYQADSSPSVLSSCVPTRGAVQAAP